VKSAAKVGVFVAIGRGVDARVKLGQLSASFVEDVAVAFPIGKLVKGRIISVTGDRSVPPAHLASVCTAAPMK